MDRFVSKQMWKPWCSQCGVLKLLPCLSYPIDKPFMSPRRQKTSWAQLQRVGRAGCPNFAVPACSKEPSEQLSGKTNTRPQRSEPDTSWPPPAGSSQTACRPGVWQRRQRWQNLIRGLEKFGARIVAWPQ